MTITNVPPNGDCFYNVIQLFLTTINDPITIHIPQLRNCLTKFYTTRHGQTILKYYHQNTHIIETSTLPNLKPSHFPNRDIAAQDYDIASIASILNTNIHVYLYQENQPLQKVTFQPHPIPPSLKLTTTSIPDIHIWHEKSHFQLLTPNGHHRPTIPPLLFPLPSNLPVLNKTPSGRTKLIKALQQYTVNTNCPYAPLPSPTHIPTAFCKDTCHKYCPNHYTAFRPVPLKITRDRDSQRIVNAVGVPKHTPLFEASGIIYKSPQPQILSKSPHAITPPSYPHTPLSSI